MAGAVVRQTIDVRFHLITRLRTVLTPLSFYSIAREDWNVPLPTVEEVPAGSTREDQLSMHSFVAMCRLTDIVECVCIPAPASVSRIE